MKETGPLSFAAYKAGMVSVSYSDMKKGSPTQNMEIVTAATVLATPPLQVMGIILYKTTATGIRKWTEFWTEKSEKDLSRKLSVPKNVKKVAVDKEIDKLAAVRLLVHTKPRTAVGKKTPEIFEVPLGGNPKEQWAFAKEKLGKEITAADVFKEGELVDVAAVSTGKGFQGPVKRFGIVIRSRKNKGKRRHVGSIGPVTPGKVLPGKIPYAGQHGFQTRTEQNKKILKIASGKIAPTGGFLRFGEVNGPYLLVAGSVPGPKKRLIMLQKGVRSKTKPEPIELKSVLLQSQQ